MSAEPSRPSARVLFLLKVLFALVAIAAGVGLFTAPPAEFDEAKRLQRGLLLGGLLAASLGMLVPWGRWMRLRAPGRNLGLYSKALGWLGACGLPLALAFHEPLAVALCVLLPVATFALWKGRAWAFWPCLVIAWGGLVASLVGFVSQLDSLSAYSLGGHLGRILIWGGFGYVLFRELSAWRRTLMEASGVGPDA